MRVILQENITNLGRVGDKVKVKSGYARNFLLPKNKAVIATEKNIELFETRREMLEKKAADTLQVAQNRAEQLKTLTLSIAARASDEGKLFGSVGPREITEAINAAGQEIDASEIVMSEGALRHIGEYDIHCQLHGEVSATVKLVVTAEEAAS